MTDDNSLPRAVFSEVTLADQPATDKGFKVGDTTYRVRVMPAYQASPLVQTSSGTASPSIVVADVSVTRLNADGSVFADAAGRPIVLAQTRITFDQRALTDGLSPADSLSMTIGNLLWQADKVATGHGDLSTVLADWGHASGPPAPAAPPQLTILTLPAPTMETSNG